MGFRWIAVYGGWIFLVSVFLLLLAGIISTLTVFGKFSLIFQVEFCLLLPHSIARERAVTKYIADSWLNMNDFVIHSSGLEL